jgi:hypothetical protein
MFNKKKMISGAASAASLTLALSACGASDLQSVTADPGCKPGPRVFAIPDVSFSTQKLTGPNGPYEKAMMKTLKETAKACGDVYSSPADGNSVAKAWVIDGEEFRQTVGGNDAFGEAARANKAEELLPKVRSELQMQQTAGSDLLGSFQRIKLALDDLNAKEEDRNRPAQIVALSDGALVVKGKYSMYETPLDTPERRTKFIQKLADLGELPDFGGKVDIYLGGIGVGVSDRDNALDIIATWQMLVPAMHARLKSIDATLRFP